MSVGSIGSSMLSQWSSNLFNKLDTKQQGYIEQSDLESALAGSASTSSSSAASQIFSNIDADDDGKITQTELTSGIENLVSALTSQLRQSQMQGAGGPPPPPPGDGPSGVGMQGGMQGGEDVAFTKDELTSMASDGSVDSKRADLFSRLADNFDTADTDGDGKINRDEAMAFDQSNATSSTSGVSDASVSSSTDQTDAQLALLLKMVEMMQTMSSDSSTSSSLSVSA